jgi:hypothetical protein
MDTAPYRSFFLQPEEPSQRHYELFRAIFVEDLSLQEAAQRFGYRYDTVRALVARFRRRFDADELPPFSPRHAEDDHPAP